MKRLDEGKTSLVDFMRSIRYLRHHTTKSHDYFSEKLAGFSSHKRNRQDEQRETSNREEKSPIRSAN
jgi:ribosomal protein S20